MTKVIFCIQLLDSYNGECLIVLCNADVVSFLKFHSDLYVLWHSDSSLFTPRPSITQLLVIPDQIFKIDIDRCLEIILRAHNRLLT